MIGMNVRSLFNVIIARIYDEDTAKNSIYLSIMTILFVSISSLVNDLYPFVVNFLYGNGKIASVCDNSTCARYLVLYGVSHLIILSGIIFYYYKIEFMTYLYVLFYVSVIFKPYNIVEYWFFAYNLFILYFLILGIFGLRRLSKFKL